MKGDNLPDSFWALPEGTTDSPILTQIYADITTKMRDEFAEMPGYGVLEQMLIERVCFLYIHIRAKEMTAAAGTNGFAHDRAYKETLQLWQSMAADVRKSKAVVVNVEEIRDMVIGHVNDTIQGVLASFHPDVADGLREKFVKAFDEAGL